MKKYKKEVYTVACDKIDYIDARDPQPKKLVEFGVERDVWTRFWVEVFHRHLEISFNCFRDTTWFELSCGPRAFFIITLFTISFRISGSYYKYTPAGLGGKVYLRSSR